MNDETWRVWTGPAWMPAWLGDKPWRFTLWVPVLIGLGISAYFWLGSEPPAGLGWTAGMISLIALGPLSRKAVRGGD